MSTGQLFNFCNKLHMLDILLQVKGGVIDYKILGYIWNQDS